MTNGEKIKEIFPYLTKQMLADKINVFEWWNAEYEEPTTKNDCEHCSKTYGTLGCCTTVNNEWVYSCKEGHDEYARGIRKLGSTTKNDLGVDCISKKSILNLPRRTMRNYFGEVTAEVVDVKDIMNLPTVIPQEPRKGKWIIDGHHRRCPECGEYFCIKDAEGNEIPNSFCPNCSADMREVEE